MRIYLMRHSETDWNREGRVQGHTDIHLNMNGMKIAAMTGDGMADIPIDLCFTSPLVRAQETAGLVLARNKYYIEKGAITKLDERLSELNFGEWEGRLSNPALGEIDRTQYHLFFREKDAEYLPDGAETVAHVIKRTSEFLDDISGRPELQDKNILVMSHGCAIRCMLRRFFDDPEYFDKPKVLYNCEAEIIDKNADGELYLSSRDVLYYDSSLAEDLYKMT